MEEGFERCLWFDAYGLGKVAASAKASLYEVLFHAVVSCYLVGLFVEFLEIASERFVLLLDYSFQGRYCFRVATRSRKMPGEQRTQLSPGGDGAWGKLLYQSRAPFFKVVGNNLHLMGPFTR